jgi:hypothetical protein
VSTISKSSSAWRQPCSSKKSSALGIVVVGRGLAAPALHFLPSCSLKCVEGVSVLKNSSMLLWNPDQGLKDPPFCSVLALVWQC